jgi:hypothetical protein
MEYFLLQTLAHQIKFKFLSKYPTINFLLLCASNYQDMFITALILIFKEIVLDAHLEVL